MIKPFLTLVISSCIIVSDLPGKIINYSKDEKQDQFEIPFILDRNLIIIQGKLNNQEECNFIFDTGTQGIVISDSITYKYIIRGGSKYFDFLIKKGWIRRDGKLYYLTDEGENICEVFLNCF